MSGQPSYTETIKLELQIADLQSQLTQRTAERDTARRRVDELEAREVDVVLLRDDLEQRTAELEAATEAADTAIDKVQFLEKRNRNLIDALDLGLKVKADQDVRLENLQAELERVRGELVDERTAYKALSEQYNRLDLEHSDLRTLIASFPKVEGGIEVRWHNESFRWQVWAGLSTMVPFRRQLDADAFAALLTHRQGMEG